MKSKYNMHMQQVNCKGEKTGANFWLFLLRSCKLPACTPSTVSCTLIPTKVMAACSHAEFSYINVIVAIVCYSTCSCCSCIRASQNWNQCRLRSDCLRWTGFSISLLPSASYMVVFHMAGALSQTVIHFKYYCMRVLQYDVHVQPTSICFPLNCRSLCHWAVLLSRARWRRNWWRRYTVYSVHILIMSIIL